jgi:hypothetical protein
MLISILFGVKSLKTNKYSFVLLSTVFGNLAFLNRQIGIIWPVALAMAFVVKSVYLKKAYLKQLAFVLLPTALSFFAYKYWLSLGNQTNAQYLFIEVNFNNIMKRWYPLGTHLLRPTNEVYDEVMYRSSIYLIFLLSLLTPLLLVFKHNLSSVKKNIQPLLIGVAILVAIYAILATRAQTDYANWKILRYPNILPTPLNGYEPLWRKIWHILLVVAFPLWAYFIGTSVVKATQSIFSHKKKVNYVWYGYSNLAILSVSSMYILRAVYKEGTEALPYLYFVTLWALAAALIVFFLFFYNINNQKNAQVKNSLLIYFSLGTIMQLAATTLSFFAWQHYIIPFSPLIIIAIATTFKKELNLPRAYAILAVLLVFSLYSTKIDYDNSGIKWEIAERIVDKGIVKPTEVGISDWAWLPYFYHEESFERRIQEVGGDKYKIGQIHTWWDYPEYKYARQKLVFSNVMCDKTNDIEVAAVKQDIFAQNIFKKYNYCLQLSSGSSR